MYDVNFLMIIFSYKFQGLLAVKRERANVKGLANFLDLYPVCAARNLLPIANYESRIWDFHVLRLPFYDYPLHF